MEVMSSLQFIWGSIREFWDFLFTIDTPFNMSLGTLFFSSLVLGSIILFFSPYLFPSLGDVTTDSNIYQFIKRKYRSSQYAKKQKQIDRRRRIVHRLNRVKNM